MRPIGSSAGHNFPALGQRNTGGTFLIAWRRSPVIPDPPLPWLLGVARNLLRKQAGLSPLSRRLAPGSLHPPSAIGHGAAARGHVDLHVVS